MDGPNALSRDSNLEAMSLSEQLKFLKEEVKYNRNRINAIEGRMSELPRRTYSAPDVTAQTEVTDDTDFTTQDYMILKANKTIPAVRECTFAEFKNRFDVGGADGFYAVDVLVSGQLLHQEIREEHILRDKLFEQRGLTSSSKVVKDKALAKAVKIAKAATDLIAEAQSGEKWVRRIRIQSPVLLRILARVNGEKWTDRPRTYNRPFNSLIYQQPDMHKELETLEQRWGSTLDGVGSPDVVDETASSVDDDAIDDSPEALACLRAYVRYIDEKIMPEYRRFDDADVSSNAKVRFSDLWYLFRTGELVYRQVDGELPDRRDFRTGKRIWKTYWVDPVPERLVAAVTDDLDSRDAALVNDDYAFTVGCYYVDHDGEEFCVVKTKVRIEQFPGEMPISALPIYPMRFCQDWQGRLEHATRTGESLINFMNEKHCSYNGWTLTQSPSGEAITDMNGEQLQQPEHVNSEVMVDFGEAFQACPIWRPMRAMMRQKVPEGLTVQEDFRICWWSGPDRASLLGETTEMIPVKSGVAAKQRNQFVVEDPFLVAVSNNAKRLEKTTAKDLTEETKALLTGRVFAYVFQERKFLQLAVAKLRQSPSTGLALNSLRIPQSVKNAIQGSVQGHFMQKRAERKMDQGCVSLDLIQGKGSGLFILLHGVPGVGKTATAEAIAQANGKPLFKITVGDLGMTPEKLETSLREIFRLASIWDCILLLDEVDTFFSQRSRADTATTKNALVSVFLRVLDYYSGILFLTTNRAGVLDEAFKSRIHFKIYYPDLSLEQTLDIWRLNIQRVHIIERELSEVEDREPLQINPNELLAFATRRFRESMEQKGGPRPWNGRQIRNAFQVARSLAYFEHGQLEELHARRQSAASANGAGQAEARGSLLGPPTLDVRHFETMHLITAQFEDYRTAIRGGTTDSDIALENESRYDRYKDRLTEGLQDEYSYEHHRAASLGANKGATDDTDPSAGSLAVTTTVAVNGRVRLPEKDELSTNETYHLDQPTTSTRGRSNSHLSQSGLTPLSNTLFNPSPPQPQRSLFPAPGSRGNVDVAARYSPAGPPRTSYPLIQTFGGVQRNGAPQALGMPGTFRLPQQYGTEGGGVAITTAPRGPSPGIGEGGVALGGGKLYDQQEYYSPDGFGSLPREGMGMLGTSGRHGSAGWEAGSLSYANQFAGHGRNSLSTSGPGRETDLSPDEVQFGV